MARDGQADKLGRIDIKRRVAENRGSDQLHGSFANTPPDIRISLTFGFHRRTSVLARRGSLGMSADEVWDEQRIFERVIRDDNTKDLAI